MILVAIAMVAIIAMAALSIDVITLYLAREEAQRSADSAALASAKMIALSGLTGDPSNSTSNWGAVCGADGLATSVAQAVAGQNVVGSIAANTVSVTYSAGSGGSMVSGVPDCSSLSTTAFGVNPIVTVRVQRTNLPTFFSRIWGNTSNSVSATATAEAFNSSNSGNVGNSPQSAITPVQPRCVKPWVVPNLDPLNPANCNTNCTKFVDQTTGAIEHQGISLGGAGASGVIGETFWMVPDCQAGAQCNLIVQPPQANYISASMTLSPNLLYVPNQVATPAIAVPACASGNFESAIAGCDQPADYSCGQPNANIIDTTINPSIATTNSVSCLIHQGVTSNVTSSSGQDYLSPFAAPSPYPFQILSGSSSPAQIASGTPVSNSDSIVSLPIYDNTTNTVRSNGTTQTTFVGFLQVFINAVDTNGDMEVTVLNVAGCSNGGGGISVGSPVVGNSPVPVRLITPP